MPETKVGKYRSAEQRYIAREAKLDRSQSLTILEQLQSRRDEPLLKAITLYVKAAHHAELIQAESLAQHQSLHGLPDLRFVGNKMRQNLRLQSAGELDDQA